MDNVDPTVESSSDIRILFWNVNKKNLDAQVCSIADCNQVDAVVLLENGSLPQQTLNHLRSKVFSGYMHADPNDDGRFHCFTRSKELDLSQVHSGTRTSTRKLQIAGSSLLLVLVHGIDIRNNSSEHRQSFYQSMALELEFVKDEKKCDRLILLGDFNINPFESGMDMPAGLNAQMTKSCIKSGQRKYNGKHYDFYYNPMWSLFGDLTDGPAGTIYNTSRQGRYGWSMLDQALIHYSAIDHFSWVKIPLN